MTSLTYLTLARLRELAESLALKPYFVCYCEVALLTDSCWQYISVYLI